MKQIPKEPNAGKNIRRLTRYESHNISCKTNNIFESTAPGGFWTYK